MRLTKLANWLSEGDLEKYQQQAQRASAAQAQLQKTESELEQLSQDFQQIQKELTQAKAQLQINQGFQIELGETQLRLQKADTEIQSYKKELFEQTKQLNLLQSQLTQAKQAVARSQNWTEQVITSTQVQEIRKTLPKQDFDTLWGFGIISPQVESKTIGGAIIVKGWVLGKQAKAETLRVTYQAENIIEVPVKLRRPKIVEQYPDITDAHNCGFEFPLAVVGIPTAAEFSLSAVLEDETIVPLCIIVFQSVPIESKDT